MDPVVKTRNGRLQRYEIEKGIKKKSEGRVYRGTTQKTKRKKQSKSESATVKV